MSRGVQFNEDQINEFHEAFLLYDNRGDGKIPVNLIGDVMRALGQNPTESEVSFLFEADQQKTNALPVKGEGDTGVVPQFSDIGILL